jgi:hypothetical protein
MNKKTSKKWYKKIWVWLIISVSIIIIVFGVPLAINYFYTKVIWFHTDWNGGSALQFYGTILSFFSTTLLGVVAIYQNNRANEVNKSIMAMNSKKQIAYLVPKTTTLKCDENMCFDFINKGNSFGIIRLVTLQKNGEIILQKAMEEFVDCDTEYKFDSHLKIKDENEDLRITIEFLIQNPFEYEYTEKIIIDFDLEYKDEFISFKQKKFNIVFRNSKEAF